MYKEIKLGRVYINFGATLREFSLGVNISRHDISLNLAFVWISIELPIKVSPEMQAQYDMWIKSIEEAADGKDPLGSQS